MKNILSLLLVCLVIGAAAGTANGQAQSTEPEARLVELGIELMPPGSARSNRVSAVRTGNLVFIAGHGPRRADGTSITGKADSEVNLEEGYEAGRLAGINLLSSLKHEIGDLNRVKRVVRVFGMVNADPDFTQMAQIINGCSDLMVEVFGENGKHARAAVGMASLPGGWTVEIEMIVELME